MALAAEAVPGLHLRVHLEARAVFLVERAQPPQRSVALGQPHVLLDDLDQVDLGLNLGKSVVGVRGRGHRHYCGTGWPGAPLHGSRTTSRALSSPTS